MRNYKGYAYKKVEKFGIDFYELYNEKNEIEVECISLNELKKIVDDRIEFGYWAY